MFLRFKLRGGFSAFHPPTAELVKGALFLRGYLLSE